MPGRPPLWVRTEGLPSESLRQNLPGPGGKLDGEICGLNKAENFDLEFEPEAIEKIADMAVIINENVENIGARRLHTVLEILLEDISFNASDRSGEKAVITAAMVEEKLAKYTEASDLSKFIL